jgi:hypothetical protein
MIIKKIEMKAGMKTAENMTAGKNGFTNRRELNSRHFILQEKASNQS